MGENSINKKWAGVFIALIFLIIIASRNNTITFLVNNLSAIDTGIKAIIGAVYIAVLLRYIEDQGFFDGPSQETPTTIFFGNFSPIGGVVDECLEVYGYLAAGRFLLFTGIGIGRWDVTVGAVNRIFLLIIGFGLLTSSFLSCGQRCSEVLWGDP